MTAPLSWSYSRTGTLTHTARAYDDDDGSKRAYSDYSFWVTRLPSGVWEAHVEEKRWLGDETLVDDVPWPGMFLGGFVSAAQAKEACDRYFAADEQKRSRTRRRLAEALAGRVASIETVENRPVLAKIEKLGRTNGRTSEEVKNARSLARAQRRKLYRAGA
jgi:hypothetical protein